MALEPSALLINVSAAAQRRTLTRLNQVDGIKNDTLK